MPGRGLKIQEEGGVGEDGTRSITIDVHRKLVYNLSSVGAGVSYATSLVGNITLKAETVKGGLGIPGFTVVELDALPQLKAPGVRVYLLPTDRGVGGDDSEVVTRLPGQRILKIGSSNRCVERGANGKERAQLDRLLRNHQNN